MRNTHMFLQIQALHVSFNFLKLEKNKLYNNKNEQFGLQVYILVPTQQLHLVDSKALQNFYVEEWIYDLPPNPSE